MTRLAAHPSPNFTGDSPAASTPQGLADRTALAFTALERTRMPMVISDARQASKPIVLANRAFLELTGYDAHEVIGRNCRFLQGRDTAPEAVAEVRAAIAAQRTVNIELLNYKKDGTPFWNQLVVSPIHDQDGQLLYFFASQLDVTRRRRIEELEEAERLLLREVDHRAMNALALVQAIVGLTRTDSVEHYATAVRGRVQALARAHATLANRGWAAVPLADLIEGEIPRAATGRVTLQGPATPIKAQLVQPLVLLLHEMTSNAAAHGALSAPGGRISIHWREDPEQGALRLHWREEGGPEPSPDRREGFGAIISKALVERQLQGRLVLDWRQEGLDAQIAFPNPCA